MRSQTNRAGFIIFAICLVGIFVTFVLLDSDQNVRSNRACFPIAWAGNLTASSVSLFDQHEASTLIQSIFRPALSACTNSSYQLFYGSSLKAKIKNFSENLFK